MILNTPCGHEVIIDDEDVSRLTGSVSLGSHGYAQMWNGRTVVLVHRVLMNAPPRIKVDHKDRDPLNCRKSNLRLVTDSESSSNVSGRGKSSYRGVYATPSGRWAASVKYGGTKYHLGTFDTEEEAAMAARERRLELLPGAVD